MRSHGRGDRFGGAAAQPPVSRRSVLAGLSGLMAIGCTTIGRPPAGGGRSPREIGALIVRHYLGTAMPLAVSMDGYVLRHEQISYWETGLWYGALRFAERAGDTALRASLRQRFEPLLGPQAHLVGTGTPDQDTSFHGAPLFGIVAFELFLETGDERYRAVGRRLADRQWEPPAAAWLADQPAERRRLIKGAIAEGLSWQTRYWIDDAYIIVVLQARAFRATGEAHYIDRAAREMRVHLERLQLPNGLFHHGPQAPIFWGRGNGWVAAGLVELLAVLPPEHEDRAFLLAAYRRMMATLLRLRDPGGMWRQILDDSDAWPETSCSAMFAFAMLRGASRGWLDDSVYWTAADRAWRALDAYIDDQGITREVCEGTMKSADPAYYLARRRLVGDAHGQMGMIWCAGERLAGPGL